MVSGFGNDGERPEDNEGEEAGLDEGDAAVEHAVAIGAGEGVFCCQLSHAGRAEVLAAQLDALQRVQSGKRPAGVAGHSGATLVMIKAARILDGDEGLSRLAGSEAER